MTLMDKQGLEKRQPKQIPGCVAEPTLVTKGASIGDPGGGVEVPSLLRGNV